MNNKFPPSKPALIAAVLPVPVAIACMLGFGHFGISLGVILSIVGLAVYYIIFGIVLVVRYYKYDTAQRQIDKAVSPVLKIATVLLIIFTIGLIGGAFAAFALKEKVIGIACVGAWLGFIFIFVMAIACSSHVRKTPPKSANRRGEGVCVLCVPAISVSVLSGSGKSGPQYKQKRTYKIIVDLDGRRLTAYSHGVCKQGDTVNIAYSDNSRKCYII